jgi:hypothetical protein
MGSALFEKRHYTRLAEMLNESGSPEWLTEKLAVQLLKENKYFKPRLFLKTAGIDDVTIDEFLKKINHIKDI